MTARRVLPSLCTRDMLDDVFEGWYGFGMFRPFARSGERVAPGSGVSWQLTEARQQLQIAEAELAEMKRVAGIDRARQMEFIAFVAHELRKPLAPLRNATAFWSHGRPEDIVAMRTIIESQVA